MPVWMSSIPALVSCPGDLSVLLFNKESITAGNPSQAAALLNAQGAIGEVVGFGFDLLFDGAPGTFEVDVEVSQDNTNWYALDKITAVNSNSYWHSDYSGVYVKFVRANVITLTNSVKTTARITR